MVAVAEAAHHLPLVLGHRHDGRQGGEALVFGACHLVDLVQRFGVDIDAFREFVDPLRHSQQFLVVVEPFQLGIALHAADAAVAFGVADGRALEDGTIDVVVALLEVFQHPFCAVHPLVQLAGLAAVLRQLPLQGPLLGRVHELHHHHHHHYTQHHAEEHVEADAADAFAERHKHLLIFQGVRVEAVGVSLWFLHSSDLSLSRACTKSITTLAWLK